ncbi:MAG: hypothetical protein V3U89_04285 [Methylophilaceae bacterium]
MFKKVIVSVVLGISLLSSLALLAQNSDKPVVMAKLNVEHQLSISAHGAGEENFIQQVRVDKSVLALGQGRKNLPIPLLSGLGVVMFGLMFFVLRASRQRIK